MPPKPTTSSTCMHLPRRVSAQAARRCARTYAFRAHFLRTPVGVPVVGRGGAPRNTPGGGVRAGRPCCPCPFRTRPTRRAASGRLWLSWTTSTSSWRHPPRREQLWTSSQAPLRWRYRSMRSASRNSFQPAARMTEGCLPSYQTPPASPARPASPRRLQRLPA